MSNKSVAVQTVISLPKGGGALKGGGETFHLRGVVHDTCNAPRVCGPRRPPDVVRPADNLNSGHGCVSRASVADRAERYATWGRAARCFTGCVRHLAVIRSWRLWPGEGDPDMKSDSTFSRRRRIAGVSHYGA